MNTKKNKSKNKPRPVPLNQNPPQSKETNEVKTENIEEEKQEVLTKCEERVPKIISESACSFVEEKDVEFDAPKKPKRNRGKKKKNENVDGEDFEESKGTEGVTDESVVKSDIKGDQKVGSSKQETVLENVTPATRKKKNKKRSESEEIKPVVTEKSVVETKVSNTKETYSSQEILIKEPLEAELKAPKKKSKKKKRFDSEKSDNNEEVMSCTAAFQKILEPKDDKKELKSEDKVNEPNKPDEVITTDIAIELLLPSKEIKKKTKKNKCNDSDKREKVEEVISCTAAFSKILGSNNDHKDIKTQHKVDELNKPVEKNNPQSACESSTATKNDKIATKNVAVKIAEKTTQENKSNNSNNKNQKDEIKLLEEEIQEDSKRILDLKVLEGTQEIHLESNQSKTKICDANVSFKENVQKSKPKIANPVEKKRKNEAEEIYDATEASQISERNIDVVEQMPFKTKVDEEPYTKIIAEKSIEETNPDKETTRIEATQASTVELGKSKKSPKPPQNYEPTISKEIKSNKPEAKATVPSESSTSKNVTYETKLLKDDLEAPKVTLLPTLLTGDVSTQPKSEDVPTKAVEQKYLQTETSTNIIESECKTVPTQAKDDKKNKNKKQSPKMSKKNELLEEITLKSFEATKKNKPGETKAEKCKDMTDSLSFTPLSENVEITSVKADDSEGSICDIVPDVQYPRASSLDSNNNIVIQDITVEFTERLNIPVNVPESPLITGSGETPITTPELVASAITVFEINTVPVKSSEEKTDLKSKVMEVNKDMEDLRLSIERSLAEFTAIEKSEQEKEKSFKERQNKIKLMDTETKNQYVAFVEQEPPISSPKEKIQDENIKPIETLTPPVCPARKENKGKGKSKKKGKQDIEQHTNTSASSSTTESTTESSVVTRITTVSSESKDTSTQKEEKSDQNPEQEKGKQQCDSAVQDDTSTRAEKTDFEPIENFEDAMKSSTDDVNKTFEMIVNEDKIITGDDNYKIKLEAQNNPEINVTAPIEEDKKADDSEKINPVSQPKNLLGHPDIPVRLNKADYKKEKHKTPNARKARVNVKDSVLIDKESKESQTEFKRKFPKEKPNVDDTVNCTISENEEFVYKYSFRKVFLPSACHVCKKELKQARFPCSCCNLVFYCSPKHKDEDIAQHQGFCFAVSTIAHLKSQKHIYADAHNITGHDYRLLRMQMIVSCEKVLKRKLTPCEQEMLLYPRICADVGCREWRHARLQDCDGCGQISFCIDRSDHFPKSHQRWCKSYALYQKLVMHQQTLGRLEPRLPARVMMGTYRIPDKINLVLASMYEEKIASPGICRIPNSSPPYSTGFMFGLIGMASTDRQLFQRILCRVCPADMNDIQYASLTQVATAPLTAAYSHQLYTSTMNSSNANGVHKKSTYTLHVVGAELQFEADALNKWEVFFLHLKPDITVLRVVLIGHDLNPSNLPLELLSKIRLCENCRQSKRRVVFDFQDGKSYHEYWSTDFITPDLVCAFNPSIQRSSIYNGRDHWASATKSILRLKVPFVVTSYTLIELHRDLARIKEISDIEVNVISEPNYNSFASVRPDRNFISDDEMPLLFKNYCFMLISGAV